MGYIPHITLCTCTVRKNKHNSNYDLTVLYVCKMHSEPLTRPAHLQVLGQ